MKEGKMSAKVKYLVDLQQSFLAILRPDGRWNGRLTKQVEKQKVTLYMPKGKISRQRMSQVSEFLQGDSYILLKGAKAERSKRGKLLFQIKLTVSPELEVLGFMTHKSGKHYTRIELCPCGRWNAKGWVGLTGGRFLFSAEIGKCETSFEGTPRFVPKRSGLRIG
jgi:hypothetical protein